MFRAPAEIAIADAYLKGIRDFDAQGNQPDIHAVHLFNAAGRPDLTQTLERSWITHAEIQNGGTLKFVMSDKPPAGTSG
jgi:putative alpha-1,2-mannosidase